MKLKKAKKIAKKLGFGFVAVDKDLSIYGYTYNHGSSSQQWLCLSGSNDTKFIGVYTG